MAFNADTTSPDLVRKENTTEYQSFKDLTDGHRTFLQELIKYSAGARDSFEVRAGNLDNIVEALFPKLGLSIISTESKNPASEELFLDMLSRDNVGDPLVKSGLLMRIMGIKGLELRSKAQPELREEFMRNVGSALAKNKSVELLEYKVMRHPGKVTSDDVHAVFVGNRTWIFDAMQICEKPQLSQEQAGYLLSLERYLDLSQAELYKNLFQYYFFDVASSTAVSPGICTRFKSSLQTIMNSSEADAEHWLRQFVFPRAKYLRLPGEQKFSIRQVVLEADQSYVPNKSQLTKAKIPRNQMLQAMLIGILVPLFLYEGKRRIYQKPHNQYFNYMSANSYKMGSGKKLLLALNLASKLKQLSCKEHVEAWTLFIQETVGIDTFRESSFSILYSYIVFLGSPDLCKFFEAFISKLGHQLMEDFDMKKTLGVTHSTLPPRFENALVFYKSAIDGHDQGYENGQWRFGNVNESVEFSFLDNPLVTAVLFGEIETTKYLLSKYGIVVDMTDKVFKRFCSRVKSYGKRMKDSFFTDNWERISTELELN